MSNRNKPRFRVFSDGAIFRLWRGGFGATFSTGPHDSFEAALAYRNYYDAARALGASHEAAKDAEWRNDRS